MNTLPPFALPDPKDPDHWRVEVDCYGTRSYVVYLACGALRYGPAGYGWIRRTLPRAFAKGDRELERYRKRLSRRQEANKAIRRWKEEEMTCVNCGTPIVTVTLAGVTVWAHDRDDRVVPYMTSPNGPRMCGLGDGSMAWPGVAE